VVIGFRLVRGGPLGVVSWKVFCFLHFALGRLEMVFFWCFCLPAILLSDGLVSCWVDHGVMSYVLFFSATLSLSLMTFAFVRDMPNVCLRGVYGLRVGLSERSWIADAALEFDGQSCGVVAPRLLGNPKHP
jgi:hypothetical protein